MSKAAWRQSAAIALSFIALFAALAGTVYAAKKLDGRSIRVKSLPGNRLKPRSLPANRLRPGVLKKAVLNGPLTGADIDERTLGRVPVATHADSADTAQSAGDAQTALNSINAVNSQSVNGYEAGCLPGTLLFAGACWEASASGPETAPSAATTCAARGGALPEALQLAAFAAEPNVSIEAGDEWSGDIPVYSGANTYGVATVSATGEIDSVVSTNTKKFRCVLPLLK